MLAYVSNAWQLTCWLCTRCLASFPFSTTNFFPPHVGKKAYLAVETGNEAIYIVDASCYIMCYLLRK